MKVPSVLYKYTLITIFLILLVPTQSLSYPTSISKSLRNTKLFLTSSNNDDISRRESILKITSAAATATVSLCTLSNPVLAVEDMNNNQKRSASGSTPKKEFNEFESVSNKFSITVPLTFKIITNKIGSEMAMSGQIFSALDLNSGTVITVHRENACPFDQYVSQPKLCDFVLPSETDGELLSAETMYKDATKMMIRHDEREAVLSGTSTLESVERIKDGINNGIFMVVNTDLPTGGTYTDGMGLIRESTLTRVVKARVVVQTGVNGNKSFLEIWISSPLDEWKKPVMGTKLRQIIDSIKIEGGQL